MLPFSNERFDEAVSLARLTIAQVSDETGTLGETPWLALITAEYLSGNQSVAKMQLQNFLSTTRIWSNLKAVKQVPALAATPKLLEALRGAGMPEE